NLDTKIEWWQVPVLRDDQIVERPAFQPTLTRRYTEEAENFIHANRKCPLFLYLAHTFPHTPLFASNRFRRTSGRGLYGDVVEELDWSVGEITSFLRKEKLDRNTLVIFTSDNGPWLSQRLAGGS